MPAYGGRLMRVVTLALLLLIVGCTRATAPARPASADSAKAVGADTAGAHLAAGTLSYEQRQGQVLYAKYCTICHGAEGRGDGFNAFNLDPRPRDFTDTLYMKTLSDDRIEETIREGGRGVNKSPLMPSWGGRMTKVEREQVVGYLRTFSGASRQ